MGPHKVTIYPDTWELLLSLCILGLVAAAPAPQEDEMIEAVPYVHEEIAAEPYVHDEPLETHDIAAEPYVHTEIEAEAYVHEEPVPAPAVYQYAAVAAVKTGCINSVGSVVPCAV